MNNDELKIVIKNCIPYTRENHPTKIFYFFDTGKSNKRIMKLNQILDTNESFNRPNINLNNLQYIIDFYSNTITTFIDKRIFDNWNKYKFQPFEYYEYYFWESISFKEISLFGIEKIKNACELQIKKEKEKERKTLKTQLSYKQQQDRKYF